MKRLSIALALLTLLVLSTQATANDRRYLRCPVNSGDDCALPIPLATQQELINTGVWAWSYRQDVGAPSLRFQIEASHQDYSREFGIDFAEVSEGNIEWARTSSTFYYGDGTTYGCPGAVGCLPVYGLNTDIWYDANVMATYYTESGNSVARHEDCHAIADCGEMYIHTGGQILCNSDPNTVMSCGIGHALFLTAYDKETIRRYLFPAPIAGAGLNGTIVGYSKTTPYRATRIAIIFETYTGYRFWSGQYATPCFTDGGNPWHVCGTFPIQNLGPCTRVLLGAENAIRGSWGNLTDAGWTSCF